MVGVGVPDVVVALLSIVFALDFLEVVVATFVVVEVAPFVVEALDFEHFFFNFLVFFDALRLIFNFLR